MSAQRGNNDDSGDEIHVVCIKCNKEFSSVADLLVHSKTHKINNRSVNSSDKSDKMFSCNKCGREFITKKCLTIHNRSCGYKTEPRECGISKKQKVRLEGVACVESDHPTACQKSDDKTKIEGKHVCSFCGEVMRNKAELVSHKRVCKMKSTIYKCADCDFESIYQSSLSRHKAIHKRITQSPSSLSQSISQLPPYSNEATKFEGRPEMWLDDPVKAHFTPPQPPTRSGKKKNVCRYCNKELSRPDNLRRHMLKCGHNSEKANKAYALKMVSTPSMPTKPPEDQYQCPKCRRTYKLKIRYLMHLKTCQNASECKSCRAICQNDTELLNHITTICPKTRVACEKCGKFMQRMAIEGHALKCKMKEEEDSGDSDVIPLLKKIQKPSASVSRYFNQNTPSSPHPTKRKLDISTPFIHLKKVNNRTHPASLENKKSNQPIVMKLSEFKRLQELKKHEAAQRLKPQPPNQIRSSSSSHDHHYHRSPHTLHTPNNNKDKGEMLTMHPQPSNQISSPLSLEDHKYHKTPHSLHVINNNDKREVESDSSARTSGFVRVEADPLASSKQTHVQVQMDILSKPYRMNLEDPNDVKYPDFNIHKDVMSQIETIYSLRWTSLMSHIYFGRKHSVYNARLGNEKGGYDIHNLKDFLIGQLYSRMRYSFKINVSCGSMLYSPEDRRGDSEYGSVQYHWPSHSNFQLFENNYVVTNYSDFLKFIEEIENADFRSLGQNIRESTKWQLLYIAQLQFYVTKLKYPLGGVVPEFVGCGLRLPAHIRRRKCIIPLTHRPYSRGKMYNDNLCIFRCLVKALKIPLESPTDIDSYANLYYSLYYHTDDVRGYKGFALKDLHLFERCFNINVNVFRLRMQEDTETNVEVEVCEVLRESSNIYTNTMNVNMHKNHFSYISSLGAYCKRYLCKKCGRLWKTYSSYKRHRGTECDKVREVYPGGCYLPTPNIFQLLEGCNVDIPPEVPRFFPHHLVFDTEAIQKGSGLPCDSASTVYQAEHVLCAAGVVGNFHPYDKPRVFIVDEHNTSEDVARRMLDFMIEASDHSYRILKPKFQSVYDQLNTQIEMLPTKDQKPMKRVKDALDSYLHKLPVMGFNSSRYDLCLLKKHLIPWSVRCAAELSNLSSKTVYGDSNQQPDNDQSERSKTDTYDDESVTTEQYSLLSDKVAKQIEDDNDSFVINDSAGDSDNDLNRGFDEDDNDEDEMSINSNGEIHNDLMLDESVVVNDWCYSCRAYQGSSKCKHYAYGELPEYASSTSLQKTMMERYCRGVKYGDSWDASKVKHFSDDGGCDRNNNDDEDGSVQSIESDDDGDGSTSNRDELNEDVFDPLLPLKGYLKKHIIDFVIKQSASCYLTLHYPTLLFLDLIQYVGPGTSLERYMQSFGAEVSKMPFCYEFLDHADALNYPGPPPREYFHNKLKKYEMDDNDYKLVLDIWCKKDCKLFRDYLIEYQVSDIRYLPQCVQKHADYWKGLNICLFKEGVTLASLSMRYLFNTIPRGVNFSLIDKKNIPFYQKLRKNVAGGLSLIITRLMRAGVDCVHSKGAMCKKIFSYDANSLYLGCLSFDFPVSHFSKYSHPHFTREKAYEYGYACLEYLTCYAVENNCEVFHKFNSKKEYRACGRSVDGVIYTNVSPPLSAEIVSDYISKEPNMSPYSSYQSSKTKTQHKIDKFDVCGDEVVYVNGVALINNRKVFGPWPSTAVESEHINHNKRKSLTDNSKPKNMPKKGITILQYHGCYFHGHENCPLAYKKMPNGEIATVNKTNNRPFKELYEETLRHDQQLRDAGYDLIVKWECDWLNERKTPQNQAIINDHFYANKYHPTHFTSESHLLNMVKSGEIFGFCEVDAHCPEHLKEHFAMFPPFFKKVSIDKSKIESKVMKEYVEKYDLMKTPTECLILSYHVQNALLLTTQLAWYLNHGMEVTRVHSFYSFKPQKVFDRFVASITKNRRAGDEAQAKLDDKILSNMSKLSGNASIGRSLLNRSKHKNVKICNDKQADELVNNAFYDSIDEIDDHVHEVSMKKRIIRHDTPTIIGATVYSLAKVCILKFLYDFLFVYCDRALVSLLNHDTDSVWIALGQNTLDECVLPEKQRAFYEVYDQYLVAEACSIHHTAWVEAKCAGVEWNTENYRCCVKAHQYFSRKPLLFKIEYTADYFTGLNSKTYHSGQYDTPSVKFSHKGVSKKHSNFSREHFISVLETKKPQNGVNYQFQMKGSTIYSARQERIGLSFLYLKRKVLDDNVSTEPLSM